MHHRRNTHRQPNLCKHNLGSTYQRSQLSNLLGNLRHHRNLYSRHRRKRIDHNLRKLQYHSIRRYHHHNIHPQPKYLGNSCHCNLQFHLLGSHRRRMGYSHNLSCHRYRCLLKPDNSLASLSNKLFQHSKHQLQLAHMYLQNMHCHYRYRCRQVPYSLLVFQ